MLTGKFSRRIFSLLIESDLTEVVNFLRLNFSKLSDKFLDIDKQEFNLVPLDLKTFIDFYVFLLGIRFCTDFTLLRQS